MTATISGSTGSFTIPAGLSVGNHTIQIRETNAPSILSSTVSFTVSAPAAIAPALGTTNLLFDLDPNIASTVTSSGGVVTAIAGANGTTGSLTAHGSPTIAAITAAGQSLNSLKLVSGTSDYMDGTSALLSKMVTQLNTNSGAGVLTVITVLQPNDTNGSIALDLSVGSSSSGTTNRFNTGVNGSTYQVRAFEADATNYDGALIGSAAYGSGSPVLLISQFQNNAHPLVALNHVAAAVGGGGTAANLTLSNLTNVTIGARFVSSAANAFGSMQILRQSVYAGSNLTSGSVATAIANWATTNYGTP